MDKMLKVALLMTAIDKMSGVVNGAVNKSLSDLTRLQNKQEKMRDLMSGGAGSIAAGVGLAATLAPAVSAFMELEDSAVRLKTVMMREGGVVPADLFDKVNKKAVELGNLLPGTTSDFQNMFATMIRSGVDANLLMGETGKAAAFLAVDLKLPFEEVGKGAAKMKEALGIADKDMMGFLDTISRTRNVGVEFGEMQLAISRSAGQLKFLKLQGLEASKEVSALFAMLIKNGASGETVGTGISTALSSIFDSKKMAEANAAASKFGVSLQFLDKSGNFKGMGNFVAQLDKLKDLKPTEMVDVLSPLFGATGQDSQFIKSIAAGGVGAYNQMLKDMFSQATLQQKVEQQLGSLRNIWDATTGTFTNTLATFAESIAPELKKVAELMGKVSAAVQAFAAENPKLFKFIGIMTAIASGLLIVNGAIMVVRAGLIAMNIAAMANPLGILLIGIAAIATAIYVYWDNIVAAFITSWNYIKSFFSTAWDMFLANWKRVLLMMVNPVGAIGGLIMDAMKQWFPDFYNAGANIVQSIIDGITAKAQNLVNKVKELAQNVRDFFPFSPAKTGPLRDIHKLKLVETIAASVRPAPLVKAVSSMASQAVGAMSPSPRMAMAGAGGGGMGVSINYSPVVNISGGGEQNKTDFIAILRTHKDEIMRMIENEVARRERSKY
jgi:TP901 family phage tail tape measure protein